MHPTFARLRGIVPSLNTPFDLDGRVDEAGVRGVVEASLDARCAGLLILAVAAENRSLSLQERDRIGSIIAEVIAGRVPLIVNVTGPDLDASLILARQAKRIGADASCYQVDPRKKLSELRSELERLTETGPDLIVVQDLDWTGHGLPLGVIEGLARHCPGFQAIKIESVLAGPKYSQVLGAFGGDFHVSGGWAAGQMMEALQRGVHAFMPTAMDHPYGRVYDLFRDGQADAARDAFERMLPILAFTQQHIDISIAFFKMLRRAQGIFATDVHRCELRLDPVQKQIAGALVRRALDLDARAKGERTATRPSR
ncbi:dihydrodipicolinate synthase family protein [Microvirga pudoricolor]|uniref:dihydrodipicolinate synthase family protein n=1 Tax=Microvirga pudoricolor TaxID=2778729 RepID=UPI001950C5FC|nr:dihydrodipicolinate synthase family protein [Microvirga pudoricolor]MBM6593532.1 dihydrodipicolinate synthase family protein [Microvirga pudoricolor]